MILVPCPTCDRHARADARCPFCDADLSRVVPRKEPAGRLSRAALVVVGAAMACAENRTTTVDVKPADPVPAAEAGAPIVDAGAPIADAGTKPLEARADASPDDELLRQMEWEDRRRRKNPAMPYGAPPVVGRIV